MKCAGNIANTEVSDICLRKDFSIFRCDRQNRRGGGVLLAVSRQYLAVPVVINTFLECVITSLKFRSSTLIVGVFYRPPDLIHGFTAEFHRIFIELTHRFPHSNVLIFGDFNFPDIVWSTLSTYSPQSESHAFLQSCLDFSLIQLVTSPTRCSAQSSNILDLILTNNPDICFEITHINGLSDHDVITGRIVPSLNKREITSKHIRCYKRANFDRINHELSLFAVDFLRDNLSRTVEENWLLLKNALTNLIDKYIPVIPIKSDNTAPWFSQKLRRLNNKKKRLFKQADKN